MMTPVDATQARRSRLRHNAVCAAAAPLNALGSVAPAGSFGILMYHRVTPNPPGHSPPTYSVTPGRFEGQLRSLLGRGFHCWPLDKALRWHAERRTIPPRVFVITFDDGFANNHRHAFPILRRLRLPATIFLATAYLDSPLPFPFDFWIGDRHAVVPEECWRPLSRAECHEMLDSGWIQFGAHTHSHADFRQIPEAIGADIDVCCDVLRREFGIESPPFAFPFGDSAQGFADPRFAAAAREAGCRCALRIDNRLVMPADSPFEWPRFDVASGETGGTLAAKMNGWYGALRAIARTAGRGVARIRR